jgi:Tol biopolymer transport system component/tRNA A-37 threonylcarbamoyl transferase component Bud32
MTTHDALAAAIADRYRIEREIGAGGMATVFLAHDVKHDRRVALKVLHPDLAATIGVERFLAEIKVTANLQHPHILSLFDSGSAAGQAYYVMPFVDGESLRDRLERDRQLPVADAIQIAAGVASALEYAHKHAVIHRDIKPENILLQDGQALVADFGIALAVSAAGGQRLTQTGLSLGTPQYMSPEQAMGDKVIDARADIYALGVVTYEMLAGEPPFTGPNAQAIVAKILTERARPLRELRDRVPEGVAHAIERAIERFPADRFASAHAYAAALEGSRAASPPSLATVGASSRVRRRQLLAVVGIGGLVAGAALATVALPARRPANEYVHRRLTFDGRSWYPEISPDGRYVAFVSGECDDTPLCTGDVMVRELPVGQPAVLAHSVRALTGMRWNADASALAFTGSLEIGSGVFVALRTGGTPRLVGPKTDVFGFIDNSTLFTFLSPGTSVNLIDVASGATKDSVIFAGRMTSLDWSATTATWLAEREGDPLRVVLASRAGAATDSVLMPDPIIRSTTRWATGHSAILYLVGDGSLNSLEEMPVAGGGAHFSGAPRVIQRGLPRLFSSFSSSSAGRLAIGEVSMIDNLVSFDLAQPGGRPRRIAIAPGSYFDAPHIAPDGKQVAFATTDYQGNNAFLVPSDGGAVSALTQAVSPSAERPIGWMNDGKRVILASVHGPESQLSIADIKTGRIHALGASGSLSGPTLGYMAVEIAGGQLAFFHRGSLVRLDTLSGQSTEIARIAGELRRVSPDGKRIAISGLEPVESSLSIVEVATGKVTKIATLPRPLGVVVGWGRDGTLYLPKRTDTGFELWRISDSGGALTKFAALSERCWPYGFDFAVESKRAVCYSSDVYPDIWLLERPDGLGRK